MPAPKTPERFAEFLLLQRIAAGGMGEILLAVRLGDRSGRTFVVKRPPLGERASGQAAQAIAREAEVLSQARAPGIVALEAAGEIAGLPYIAVEHIRGASLDAIIESSGPLSAAATRAVALDLASALAALHAAGWVHGDVTPSNILIDDAGELRLIDLGLATRVGSKHTDIAGKPGYIAPEAVRPVSASPAEDIYAWGVVVAECALGRRLFNEESLAQAGARGETPPAIETLALEQNLPSLASALRRDPSARPDAASLVALFQPLDVDRGELAERALREPEAPRSAARSAPPPPLVRPSPSPPLAAPPSPTHAPAPDRWKRIAITLLVLIGLTAALIAGRLSARRRDAFVSLNANLPRRTQLELDGRAAPQVLDGPTSIEPGRHTITVTLPKGDRRDYAFTVRPGEHVILLPVGKGSFGVEGSGPGSP